MLDQQTLSYYRDNGYAILTDFILASEAGALRKRARDLVEAFEIPGNNPEQMKVNKISAYNEVHGDDTYFVKSLNGVNLFFDDGAFSPHGEFIGDKTTNVVKIGHALHDFDPVFREFSHSSKQIAHVLRLLGYRKPLIGQSRYFFKPPGLKNITLAHQDSNVLYTEPLSCCALWIALEDATIENGCLWVIPGSHHAGLRTRMIKDKRRGNGKVQPQGDLAPLDESAFIPLEVKAGSAVLLDGLLVHKSGLNLSTATRQAYALHFIEGADSHQYPKENWLQRPGGFRELDNY